MISKRAVRMSGSSFEPFYFTSYGIVVGVAKNLKELDLEMKRLSREDRACVEYHLSSGNLVRWLEYSNQLELSTELVGITNADEAIQLVERYLSRAVIFHRMRRGRMR